MPRSLILIPITLRLRVLNKRSNFGRAPCIHRSNSPIRGNAPSAAWISFPSRGKPETIGPIPVASESSGSLLTPKSLLKYKCGPLSEDLLLLKFACWEKSSTTRRALPILARGFRGALTVSMLTLRGPSFVKTSQWSIFTAPNFYRPRRSCSRRFELLKDSSKRA